MKLGGYKLGLLINFNVPLLKYGVRRVVDKLQVLDKTLRP